MTFDFYLIFESLPKILGGLGLTLQLFFLSAFLGLTLAVVFLLMRISGRWYLSIPAVIYIYIFRGTPILIQIFVIYYGLPQFQWIRESVLWSVLREPFGCSVIALSLNTGAYVAEMVRAGIQSIHRGQTEASRSLGMTYLQSMVHVILPQAMRRILPPLAGQFISLIKDSSLLGIIAIRELTKATREGVTASLMVFELWFVCAILYLLLTFTLSMLVQYLERRMETA